MDKFLKQRDRLIYLGSGTKRTPLVRVSLIEIRSGKIFSRQAS